VRVLKGGGGLMFSFFGFSKGIVSLGCESIRARVVESLHIIAEMCEEMCVWRGGVNVEFTSSQTAFR
jgi:hypothetical protein